MDKSLMIIGLMVLATGATGCTDTDGDGVPNPIDNCPNVPNPLEPHPDPAVTGYWQPDSDDDGIGDACDTEDWSWGTPVRLRQQATGASNPQLAVDRTGNAIAVWSEGGEIHAARFTPGDGWGTPESIGVGGSIQVTSDRLGNAIAVWSEGSEIHAARFTPGDGWAIPEVVETGTGSAYKPQLGIDRSGEAVAVWTRYEGSQWSVRTSRFTLGTGWAAAEVLDDDTGYYGYPHVAVNPDGQAVAVWAGNEGSNDVIFANRFTAEGGWEMQETLEEAHPLWDASDPRVAMDDDGNAMVIWNLNDEYIHTARFTPDAGWEAAESLSSGSSGIPQVAFDRDGSAVAVWSRYVGGEYPVQYGPNIFANRFTPEDGWGTPEVLETSERRAGEPKVVFDHNGNAFAVWIQSEAMWTAHFTPETGWAAPEAHPTTGYSASAPQVAFDRAGHAIAVWRVHDGGSRSTIWSIRFE